MTFYKLKFKTRRRIVPSTGRIAGLRGTFQKGKTYTIRRKFTPSVVKRIRRYKHPLAKLISLRKIKR